MSWEIIWNDPWKSSYHTLKSKANVTYVNLCCLPTCHSRTPSPIQCFMCGLFHTHYFPHPKITRVHSLFDLAAPHFFPGSQYSRIRKKKLRVAVFRLKGICHLPSTNNKHKKKKSLYTKIWDDLRWFCVNGTLSPWISSLWTESTRSPRFFFHLATVANTEIVEVQEGCGTSGRRLRKVKSELKLT